MGKVILCAGKTAEKPYYFKSTDSYVYTIEELCYYIYHNLETVGEELLNKELVEFMREELGLAERADIIEKHIRNHAGLKDVVVSIFCSADYYDESEIKYYIAEMDRMNAMSSKQRKKLKADKCLSKGQNKEALRVYRDILMSKDDEEELTPEEHGNVFHNMGVIYMREGAFVTGADSFREAYERNENPDSLRQYMHALRISRQDKIFEEELKRHIKEGDLIKNIENELYHVVETEENILEYHEICKLKELRESGLISEYYDLSEDMIRRLKNKYRRENN